MADAWDQLLRDPERAKAELERLAAELAQKDRALEQYKKYVADLELKLARILPQTLQRAALREAAGGPTLFEPSPPSEADAPGPKGPSSDSQDSDPPPSAPAAGSPGTAGSDPSPKTSSAPRRGRTPIPPHIPREEVVHAVQLDRLPDYDPAKGYTLLSPEVSEQLHIIRPELRVLRHVRQTVLYYTPEGQKRIVTADGPSKVFDKALPTAEVLADVANKRYHLHLPLYRIQMDYRQMGYAPQRISFCRWMLNAGEILEPITDCMREEILGGFKVHLDDTETRILAPGTGTTLPYRVWTLMGGRWEKEHALFLATPKRTAVAVDNLLAGYKGFLQIDACRVYDHLPQVKGKQACFCWSHVERKFEDAATIDSRAQPMLKMIQDLYHIEKLAQDMTPEQRHALRQERTRPLLTRIGEWVRKQSLAELIRSGFKLALNYALNQWEGLQRFLEDGRLRPDNNISEGEFHVFGVSRRNHLFFGTEEAIHKHLVMFSLTRSCVANGIDPYLYFKDVLRRISIHPARRILELTPAHWKTLVGYTGPASGPLPSLGSG
jgi:transposase